MHILCISLFGQHVWLSAGANRRTDHSAWYGLNKTMCDDLQHLGYSNFGILSCKAHNSDDWSFGHSAVEACHHSPQRRYMANNTNDAPRCGRQDHQMRSNPLGTCHRSNGSSSCSCVFEELCLRESRVHSESSSCGRRH